MRPGRPVIAADPAQFGRRGTLEHSGGQPFLSSQDARLFLGTFAAGFAFTMMLII